MDKEEARFILRCFRPDGADAENPDFAEALALAARDRELGEWLAHERASDAAFAKALDSVGIPVELREEILAGLAVERGDDGGRPDELDRSLIGALASVAPPPGLRGDILAAMARTVEAPEPKKSRWARWGFFGLPVAAAAGVALAFVLSGPRGPGSSGDGNILAGGDGSTLDGGLVPGPIPDQSGSGGSGGVVPAALTLNGVEEGFIKTFESPDFTLDLENPDHQVIFKHLSEAKLPCPRQGIPDELKGLDGAGCRELKIEGKRGTLVCFKKDGNLVHLVVFKRCDVKCSLPKSGKRVRVKHGQWAADRWEDQECVFVMLKKTL